MLMVLMCMCCLDHLLNGAVRDVVGFGGLSPAQLTLLIDILNNEGLDLLSQGLALEALGWELLFLDLGWVVGDIVGEGLLPCFCCILGLQNLL